MRFLKNLLVSVLNKLTIYLVTFNYREFLESSILTRLGTPYGGWWVPTEYLQTNLQTKKILISAGLGHDVSFDVEMRAAGFTIIGLDPTEGAFVGASDTFQNETQVKIINKGLWTSSGFQRFYKPRVAGHDSFSITNSQNQDEYLEFETISLKDLVNSDVDINKFKIKVLKMDIEGAEVAILSDLMKQNLRFDFIASEIDYLSVIPFKRFRQRFNAMILVCRLLNDMKQAGYSLIKYEHYNFFWAANDGLTKATSQDTV